MLKRLISFIRYLREPVFDDPQTQRWAELLQKRARYTGQLPEPDVLAQMGLAADDPFWKQDNTNPSAGFAANLRFAVRSAIEAESAGSLDVEALDDLGREVAEFPLSKTAPQFYFHISKSVFPIEGARKAITPAEMVWCASKALAELLSALDDEQAPPSDEEAERDEEEPMSSDPSDYSITRITWDSNLKAWYVITEQTGPSKTGAHDS